MESRATATVIPRPYGDDDRIGAANEITPSHVVSAASLIRMGRCYALGRILDQDSPNQMWRFWRHSLLTDRAMAQRAIGSNRQTYVEESVSGALHSGTHLDGLAHIGIGEYAYNGHPWANLISATGVNELGIENVPPLFTRGVLIDAAAAADTAMLPDEYPVTADDLDRATRRQGVQVGPGDIVLVHTGWGALWGRDNDRYSACEPGINESGAAWCIDRRAVVIGADNWAVERVPRQPGDTAFTVHQQAITRAGVYLLENVDTAQLAADEVWEFCCVISPVRLRGASASQVCPVAII